MCGWCLALRRIFNFLKNEKIMAWFSKFLSSSIGSKLVMSMTGLFLILFLAVHLAGNLQLLHDDGGEAFNTYAYFMTHNPLIKVISYGNYFFILYHAFTGLKLWLANKAARGSVGYAVQSTKSSSVSSRNMAWFGIIILVFIILHMIQFWGVMHFGSLATKTYESYPHPVADLFTLVADTYKNGFFVIFYVISMIVVGFHLWHGFQSAFQTFGLNHKKYTPLIKIIGAGYAVLVPLGFAIIPILSFFKK
jgi:succinate dehydrogenase / fumarate reductase, cytochrome b subunit